MGQRIAGPFAAAGLGLVMAAGWMVPAEAEACSWVAMALPASPRPQAQDVPVDAVIKLIGFAGAQELTALEPFVLEALDATGAPVSPPVDITVESLPSLLEHHFPIRVTPHAGLAANTAYRLTWNANGQGGTLNFETGSGSSVAPAPPAAPVMTTVPFDPSAGAFCRDSCWSYDIGGLVLDLGAGSGTTFNLYEAGTLLSAELGAKSTLAIGCGGFGTGLLAPGAHTFELRAVNAAGQESAPVQFTAQAQCIENPGGNSPPCLGGPDGGSGAADGGPKPGGGGCAATGGEAAPWLISLLVALRRRGWRRRSTSPRG